MRVEPGRRRISRPRLDTQLDRIFDFTAGEVTGPAGSGKTTWLRSWADTTKCTDVVWFTLERRHRDTTVLGRELLNAVRRTTSVQAAVGEVGATDLVDHLIRAIEGNGRRTVIVLDEAQSLVGADSCDVLRDLIVRSDDCTRLMVAGRRLPDIGLEALRRRRELLFFTGADLRLTRPETDELVRLVMRSEPNEPDLAAIHWHVEGWALGAVLAGLVLDHVGGTAIEFLDGHRYFDQFFGSEVFGELPDDVRTFLVDTCVPPRLEPDLCAELSGRDDALTVLRGLERDNVFVEWTGGRPPVFRSHPLFRSWLLGHLERHEPSRLAELARHAASWYENRGCIADAIELRLAAGDVGAAAASIVDYGPTALGEGRYEAMRDWIGALPAALLSSSGPLLVLLAEAEHRLGDADATTSTRALARGLGGQGGGTPPLDNFELTLAVQRGTELHRAGRLETAADHGRRALARIDLTQRPPVRHRTRFDDLLLAMDVASIASQLLFTGELSTSARLSRWVAASFPVDNRNVAAVRVRCLGQAAVAELLLGARPAATELAREAQAICSLHGLDPVDVGYAELVLLVTGPDQDRTALDAVLRRRLAQVALPSHTCLAGLLRAWSYVRTGEITAARQALDVARLEMDSIPEPGMLVSLGRRVHAMIESGTDESPLGERERQTLAVLAATSSRRRAAEELCLSVNTVKTHARQAYRALGVSTLSDAVERCDALGIELDVPRHLRGAVDDDTARQSMDTPR